MTIVWVGISITPKGTVLIMSTRVKSGSALGRKENTRERNHLVEKKCSTESSTKESTLISFSADFSTQTRKTNRRRPMSRLSKRWKDSSGQIRGRLTELEVK